MQTVENLPLYWAVIKDTDDGLRFISLVDVPAIQREFIAMNATKQPVLCTVADEEKRRVYGVILRANFPIYRKNLEMGEYYLAFSPESIRATVEKFFADGRVGNVNLMHAPGSQVDGVKIVQLFIKDTAAGISPAGFEDIEDGSLFGEYHVTNPEIWAAIKAGTYRGFSIQGDFNIHNSQSQFTSKHTAMSKLEKFKSGLAKLLVELGAATTDKGAIFWDGDEDLKAGDAVFVDENGERKAAPDGNYKTEDDKTIKVENGKVVEIVDPKAEVKGAAEGKEQGAEDQQKEEPKKESGGDVEALRKDLDAANGRLDEMAKLLEKIVAALDAANVKLRAIEKAPAAASAHQEFTTGAPVGKTGNAQMDRLSRMLGGN